MLKKLLVVLAASGLAACASSPIDKFTHADIQYAESIAVTPARAAVLKTIDNALTQQEAIDAAVAAQALACINSLKPALPSGTVGIFTLNEMAAGAKSIVSADCTPIKVPTFFGVKL